jgi:hypothetical protein
VEHTRKDEQVGHTDKTKNDQGMQYSRGGGGGVMSDHLASLDKGVTCPTIGSAYGGDKKEKRRLLN